MKTKKSTKFVYIWKIPTTDGIICYIIGDEKTIGGRDRIYENGSKTSENKQLKEFKKLATIKITESSGISRDHDVHSIIKEDFNKTIVWDGEVNSGILRTREAFYFKDQSDIEKNDRTICEIVSKICTGEIDAYRRTENWQLRFYQTDIINQCLAKLSKHDKVLLNLAMRGGKSIIALEIARKFINLSIDDLIKIGVYKKILIITPFPSAIGTFRNYTLCHINMKGYNFYGNTEMPQANDTQYVKLVSFQKDWTPDFAKKLGEYDIVIVDETHNTSASWRSLVEVLPKIKHSKELHLSGTPFNDVLSNRFSKEQTVSLDIIDLMKISSAHPEMHIYPAKINVKDVCNMKELRLHLETYGKNNAEFMSWLNSNQMFSLKDIFENKVACMTFLKYISIDQRDFQSTPYYFDTQTEDKYKHIIAYIPSVKGVKIAHECLKQLVTMPDSMFFGFELLALSKDDNDSDILHEYDLKTSQLEIECNKFIDENEKTLILSCNRLTTGVTLYKLDTILNFKKISSAELFFQIMFRIMTYYPGKNEVNMFNYDSEYSIKIFKELASVRQENINALTEKDTLEEIFSCINYYKVLSGKNFEFEKVDPIKGYELFRNMPLSCSPNACIKYTINDFSYDEQNILMQSGLSAKSTEVKEIHKGKGGNSKPPAELSNKLNANASNQCIDQQLNKNSDIKKFEMALNAILNEIAWIIVENNISHVSELLKNDNIPEIVSRKNLTTIYANMINTRKGHWQTYINDLNYKKTKDYLELVKKLPKLSKTDITTPDVLIEKMVNKVY